MYAFEGVQRLPQLEGGGFMAPHLQVVAANMWHGSLSTPGSIYFVVHPKVKEKCKANYGLFDSRNATCVEIARLSGDRVLRYNTLVHRSFQNFLRAIAHSGGGVLSYSPVVHSLYPWGWTDLSIGSMPGTHDTFRGPQNVFILISLTYENKINVMII